MKRDVGLLLCALNALPGCGASDSSRSALGTDAGDGGSAPTGGATGSGGRATGGRATGSGGAAGGGTPGTGGAESGGQPGAGGGGPGTGGQADAGQGDGGFDASLDADAGTDASQTSDSSASTDGDAGCCATAAAWSASDGVLPSADCPPWGLTSTTSGLPLLDATGVTVSSVGAQSENQYYLQAAPDIRAGNTVRIAFRMRSVTSSAVTWRAGAMVGFAFGPTRTKNSLFIGTNEIFLLSEENTRGNSASVPTTDAMHDYVIDVNVGAGTVSISYDGTPTLTGTLFTNPPDTTTDYIIWGEGSIFASGTSVWSRFEHDAWVSCGAP